MDQRLHELMTTVLRTTQPSLQAVGAARERKTNQTIDQCFGKNKDNIDKFAECIRPRMQRMEALVSPVQLKMVYYSKIAEECMKAGRGSSECTHQVEKQLMNALEDVKFKINAL